MSWTWKKTKQYRDGLNIVVELEFTDGNTVVSDKTFAPDMTDDTVAVIASKRIKNVLEVGDAALAALSPITGKAGEIIDITPDPKQVAIAAAQAALQEVAIKVQYRNLNDPDVDAAFSALELAKADAA